MEVQVKRTFPVFIAAVLAFAAAIAGARMSGTAETRRTDLKAAAAGRLRDALLRKTSESRIEEEKCSRELNRAIGRFEMLSRRLRHVENEFEKIAEPASVAAVESVLSDEILKMRSRVAELRSSLDGVRADISSIEKDVAGSGGDSKAVLQGRLLKARQKFTALEKTVLEAESDVSAAERVLARG